MSLAVEIAYLVAALLFSLGIMLLRSPATARNGNLVAALGMLIALVATFVRGGVTQWGVVVAGIAIGGVIGAVAARRVAMTAMPQMVALFNAMGGGAAALVATIEILRAIGAGEVTLAALAVAFFTVLIGFVSFSGSIVAFAKLQDLIQSRPIVFPGQKVLNGLIFLALVALAADDLVRAAGPSGASVAIQLVFGLGALLIGALLVLPIGGADMPVVISLLNAFTGLAVAAEGFLIASNILIIAGSLVGASGTILTVLMARAMNRSIGNIVFGAFGQVQAGRGGEVGDRTVRSTNPEDVAALLKYAERVIIVPGFGMAVARAQKEVAELAAKLGAGGVDVRFAIHPVAGRMPGHMNVLLAEANVPYDQLYEMDAINGEFASTDVALVIGANDVTNPAARNDPSSPIYGMPILNVDQAKTVVVLKRSMNPGFAGIENELYYNPKTLMLFGDAKDSVTKVLRALDEI
ncbi:MAG: NAD(P)(+) transhydrogenase (Re/Si-specific) subunit beta [Clostridia bacterium]|nr:NAD(P)(+) transhydrogenase (Re/Si-specific) subunit beta [Clostridia bacterium]